MLNQAICQLLEDNAPDFKASLGIFEKNLGEGNAFADAVIPIDQIDVNLEFHHIKPELCKASKIAKYVMDKLQAYAIHYNLIPREAATVDHS